MSQDIEELKEQLAKLEKERGAVASETKALEKEETALKSEIEKVQRSLDRATHLRLASKRLMTLDEKIRKTSFDKCIPAVGDYPEKKSWVATVGVGLLAIAVAAVMLADGKMSARIQKYCTPSIRPLSVKNPELNFDPSHPPLLRDDAKKNESKRVQWGAAALHVCARGTSEVSFLRRDDCDGCLCPTGSVWVHYKDPRFFGNGAFCVPEQEWKTCINRWSCCAHKPNLCWDFIFDGARHDPNKTQSAVLVDTCSQHMSCYVLIKRYRKWVLLSEHVSKEDDLVMEPLEVGVDLADIAKANETLKMSHGIRGWGMPSSVLHLIKVTVSTAPQEWKEKQVIDVERSYRAGALNRIWYRLGLQHVRQLVSNYEIVAKSMDGKEHLLTRWEQREWNSYHDQQVP